MKRMSWGTFPTREEFDDVFNTDLEIQATGGYNISHGSTTNEYDPPAGLYDAEGLWNEIRRLYCLSTGAVVHSERAGSWVATILGTLGFKWV